MVFIVRCGTHYGCDPDIRDFDGSLRQPAEPAWAEGRMPRSAGLRFKLQKVPVLIERLRQSGYVLQPELGQPARRPGFFGMVWQRITAFRFLAG